MSIQFPAVYIHCRFFGSISGSPHTLLHLTPFLILTMKLFSVSGVMLVTLLTSFTQATPVPDPGTGVAIVGGGAAAAVGGIAGWKIHETKAERDRRRKSEALTQKTAARIAEQRAKGEKITHLGIDANTGHAGIGRSKTGSSITMEMGKEENNFHLKETWPALWKTHVQLGNKANIPGMLWEASGRDRETFRSSIAVCEFYFFFTQLCLSHVE